MDSFLIELARPRPDPGGGAAAAFGARLGLALLEKVVRLEIGRQAAATSPKRLALLSALEGLFGLRDALTSLQQEDVQAYDNFTAARASGDPGRLAAAVQEAVNCPRRIMQQTGDALELLGWAGERCRRHLLSDLLVAVELLAAGLRGASLIATANLPLVKDAKNRQLLKEKISQAGKAGEDLYQQVKAGLLAKMRP